jgi:hypothetical protein
MFQMENKTALERFMGFVSPEPNSGCWLWLGAGDRNGYGMFSTGVRAEFCYAHRASYELFCGPIPEGHEIDHLCRVPCCVNPHHLEAVTRAENLRRSIGTGPATAASTQERKSRTHCPQGHPYNSENTIFYGTRRYCRECGKLHRRSRRKAA